jgi:alpha-maltose-1-phosphate synthase
LKNIKIILSSYTPFHIYGLAKYLDDIKKLEVLITNYPFFKVKEYGLRKSKLKSYILTGVLLNILRKTPIYHISRIRKIFAKTLNLIFSKQVSNYIKKINDKDKFVFWGLSGYCLDSLKVMQNKSGISIIDFGSIHLKHQQNLMSHYAQGRYQNFTKVNPWMIQRQNEEFLQADLVVVSSNFSKKSFELMGYTSDKIHVKYPNLDLQMFKTNTKIKKLLKYTFLFVGNLGFNKGVESLCESFNKEFNEQEANLLIVGGSVDNDYSEYLKKYYNYINIKFLGTSSKKKLVEYYNAVDCLVQPSITDGFGKTVLESLSCGTPVICSKNVGALDILPKNLADLSWEPFNIKHIRKSLRHMHNNRQIYIKNRSKLANAFNPIKYDDKVKQKYKIIFDKIDQLLSK